jgi:hypothetical protein
VKRKAKGGMRRGTSGLGSRRGGRQEDEGAMIGGWGIEGGEELREEEARAREVEGEDSSSVLGADGGEKEDREEGGGSGKGE